MTGLQYRLLLGASLLAFSNQALAQDVAPEPPATPADAAEQDGSDIVVTAQRRSERLQDVPVSITAIGGDTLANQRIQQAGDLASAVPNLQASTVAGESTPVFSLRGISMSDYSFNQQGPVATYYDEVYKGSFPFLGLGLYDLERVEVLRGPQGTLYGKNTTGGAINFISRKPDFDTDGYLKLGYGKFNRFDVDGAVQAGLTDTLAARVAFTFSRADGWFKNQLPGKADPSGVRQYGIRGSLLFKPSDKVEFILRLSTSLANPFENGVYTEPGPDGVGAGVYEAFGVGSSYFRTGIGRFETESNYVERHRARTYSASLTGNWQMTDGLTVTSITSYDYGKLFVPDDGDGSPLKVLEDPLSAKGRQFAQDLRISSDFDGPFNFILGGYYNIETLRNSNEFRYFNDVDVNGDGAVDFNDCLDPNSGFQIACTYSNSFKQVKKTIAAYSDFNYKIGDSVILRGGLRFTRDTGKLSDYIAQLKGADGVVIANTVPGDPVDLDATTGLRFAKSTVTGKVGVDFKLADGDLIYASYSRGYRGNAFNSQALFSPVELNVAAPETVNSYEVGFKSQFLDRAVTLNGALFYYDYKNQQALSFDPANFAQTLVNIPKSRLYGAELELIVRPTSSLRLNAGLGLLNTKIQEGVVSGASIVGNKLPIAPKLSISGGFELTVLEGNGGKLDWGVNGNYNSKQYFDLFNTDRVAQKGVGIVNSQLNYRFGEERYGVGLWVKNIFNTFYKRYGGDVSGFGMDYYRIGEPRTFGVTVDARF
ncbi:TonB-dependent receptor [Sphingopyxis sp.]|jgi:iron complex outermembrane receptor protein|uniref:TonB-dependent receptor n=1 Tax=Sphingopyxis sp. TaxID=1908224 RepID=UPI002DE788FA|nr:TonB-dependent receptor [Sphingopyxis sp.]